MSQPTAPNESRLIDRRRALVVGAGIAGLAAATALHRAGWQPVIVERCAQRRTGGYFIALFGCARTAADRIGITGIRNRIADEPTYIVDRHGNRRDGIGFRDFPGSPWLMLRGDVEQAAFAALPAATEIRFATSPVAIADDDDGATVTLYDSARDHTVIERFGLVVGADGVRSTVRRLAWGADENYLDPLGFMITAFELPAALPGLPEPVGATLSEPGRSFWAFPFVDRPPSALFSYQTSNADAERERAKRIGVPARLREVYGPEPFGELMTAALHHLDHAETFLFDSVERVKIDRWHNGHIVLLGDAAWCPSLYSGTGATSALASADVLGLSLRQHPDDLEVALSEWERTLRPAITLFQDSALPMRLIFTQVSAKEQRLMRRMSFLRKIMYRVPPLNALIARSELFQARDGDLARDL